MTRFFEHVGGLRRNLLIGLIMTIVVLTLPAHSACNALGQFSNVVIEAQTLKRGGQLNMDRLERLNAKAQLLKRSQIRSRLSKSGQSAEFNKAERFLSNLKIANDAFKKYGETAARTTIYSQSFQASLKSMSNVVEKSCDAVGDLSVASASEAGVSTARPNSDSRVVLRLLPVFLLLSACITVILVSHLAVKYTKALRRNPKTLEIDASLETGGRVFEGFVTRFERQGVRFQMKPELKRQASAMIETGNRAVIRTKVRDFPVRIGLKNDDYLGLWFQSELNELSHEALLTRLLDGSGPNWARPTPASA